MSVPRRTMAPAIRLQTAFTKCNANFTELYANDAPACGRLAYVSATALSFKPYNGDRIKIAGTIYAIPSAGIAGLTNGGLSVSTLYYVYAYNNAGTITGEFSTTSHAVSTTAGNVGTEIKSGDNTRTLIGMVRTDNSSQFNDAAASRLVLSWFNRRDISLAGAHTNGITTTSSSFVEATSNARVNFLTWGEEYVTGGVLGTAANSTVSNTILAQLVIDLASAVLPVNIGHGPPGPIMYAQWLVQLRRHMRRVITSSRQPWRCRREQAHTLST